MKVKILIILLISSITTHAGGENYHISARSRALAGASVGLVDAWSSHHNQASMVFLEKTSISVGYESRFSLSDLSLKYFSSVLPLQKYGVLGLNFQSFGNTNYQENKFGLGYSMKLAERFSAGVQLNYQQINQGLDYGSKDILTFELSVFAKINEKLTLGTHIYNPSSVKIQEFNDERAPVIFRIGGSYQFSDLVLSTFEIEKDINYSASVKIGLEYKVSKIFFVRGGIATEPTTGSFGLGLYYNAIKLDFALDYHNTLGYSPHITLSYDF